jgi:hypothetical protein
MEENENVWKANLENGLIMACIGLVYTLLIYFLKLMLNPVQGYVFYAIQVAVLFFMLKSFRDKKRGGFVSYGQSLGAGMVIFTIYAVVIALFTFILYKYIDPSLIDQQLALAQSKMVEMGIPQSSIDMATEMQKTLMTPLFLSLMMILNSIIYGLVFSLVVSIFIKKEENPLLGRGSGEELNLD